MNVHDAAEENTLIVDAYERKRITGYEACFQLDNLLEKLLRCDKYCKARIWVAPIVKDNISRIAYLEGKFPQYKSIRSLASTTV